MQVEVATSPMSVDMSAWEALSSTRDGPDMDAAVFGRDGAVGSEDGLGGSQAGYGDAEQRSRSESQLGSIAAWQAIAADVSPPRAAVLSLGDPGSLTCKAPQLASEFSEYHESTLIPDIVQHLVGCQSSILQTCSW